MATNVPPVQFTPTGLVIPQESEVLAGVQADFNDAFGGDLNPALETPQGQLASSQAAVVADANAVFAEFVNQVDPDTASGFMQDAIARIYFLDRQPAAPTVVACEINGNPGTVIPIGAQAADTSGNRYVAIDSASIPPSGTVTVAFANVLTGPIPCPSNTLTIIFRAIPGWDTINNPAPGVLGRDVETQRDFAYRRAQSVAVNARGSLPSIYANVFETVPGVLDVYATENTTNAVVNTGATNYPLAPHSLYVAVVGGDSDAIARAIWEKKDVGCDYNGNTSVVVQDDSGYLPPVPEYTVLFQRPTNVPILFEVQIADDPSLPSDIEDLVKAAVIATFNGQTARPRARIGAYLLASNFYPAVVNIGIDVSVLSILLGDATPTLTALLMGIDQAPTVQESDITVTLV